MWVRVTRSFFSKTHHERSNTERLNSRLKSLPKTLNSTAYRWIISQPINWIWGPQRCIRILGHFVLTKCIQLVLHKTYAPLHKPPNFWHVGYPSQWHAIYIIYFSHFISVYQWYSWKSRQILRLMRGHI